MKQKYKVFINDQEIVFQQKKSAEDPEARPLPHDQSPPETFRLLSGISSASASKYVVYSGHPETEFKKFISKFKLIEAAGGVVRKENQSGDILMIFRLGKWDLPKGKIDEGELPEEAAVREIEEECGIASLNITSRLEDTWHLYEHNEKIIAKRTFWYLMTTSDNRKPDPQLNEGIAEAKWVNEKEIKKLLPKCYASIRSVLNESVLNR